MCVPMNDNEFFRVVREFIATKSKIPITDIEPTTPLIESGIVDSLHITELIIFIEDLLDINVDIDSFRIDSFKDIESIHRAYSPRPED